MTGVGVLAEDVKTAKMLIYWFMKGDKKILLN